MEFNSRLSGILASLGITLITAGLVAFLLQGWSDITLVTKLTFIFGFGAIAYALSLYVASRKIWPEISATLLITAIGMVMWGIEVYNDFRVHPILRSMRVLESILVLTLFLISWYVGRQVVALTGAIIATQALYLSTMYFIFHTSKFSYNGLVMAMMLIGFSYLVKQFSSPLSYWLRLIGSLLLGIALYLLGDWTIWGDNVAPFFSSHEIMWQVLWPIVGVILVYLGLRLRDNAFFIGGMTSVIGVIFSAATTYARSILGLPITLMLFGIVSIAVSYGMLRLKNKVR